MKEENLYLTPILEKKKELRLYFKEILKSIKQERRNEAEGLLFSLLEKKLKSFKTVLSFASTALEISTSTLNDFLLKEHKLILCSCFEDSLLMHRIDNLNHLRSSKIRILEPDPLFCPKIDDCEIECLLIPATSFDSNLNRLGRGKGHYDRLIARLHAKGLFPKLIGIGFREQLYEKDLPVEATDQKVEELLLF